MRIKIRNWDEHFEADRSRQWKKLSWVPIPNKQGLGYKKIMSQKNGAEIFGCWIAIVEQASLCSPRGDLSKYSIEELSINTIIPINILNNSISYIIQNLDWIEVIENLDKNVNDIDKTCLPTSIGSSMLCNSLLCNSTQTRKETSDEKIENGENNDVSEGGKERPLNPPPLKSKKEIDEKNIIPPTLEMVKRYITSRGSPVDPQKFMDHYSARDWKPKGYTTRMKDWQAAVRTWEPDGFKVKSPSKPPPPPPKEEQMSAEEVAQVTDIVKNLGAKFKI